MTTPQDFDIDAWLEDAERPARSVTVYQKAGLIADLDALQERIENAEDEDVDGPSAGGGSLRSQYAKLAKQFHDSALVIKLEGRSDAEKSALAKANPGLTGTQLGYITIADAIQSPKVTPAQLEKLADKIGETQFNQIIARFHEACTEVPAVSADFLPKRSTPDDGGE
ncbi:hypothetical protein ACFC25_04390 [Pseudarthrobacter sp. NPDC055928]|uniref:hypothetical protein n=1 Tax=Pseudarthrobacter sp. NPDC055928 TaxID=3345661 RepID=UPI0035DAD3D1